MYNEVSQSVVTPSCTCVGASLGEMFPPQTAAILRFPATRTEHSTDRESDRSCSQQALQQDVGPMLA